MEPTLGDRMAGESSEGDSSPGLRPVTIPQPVARRGGKGKGGLEGERMRGLRTVGVAMEGLRTMGLRIWGLRTPGERMLGERA